MTANAKRLAAPIDMTCIRPGDPGRPRAERFVRKIYRDAFGARLNEFHPCLLGFRGSDGSLRACLGYRPAAPGPLYLERYLEDPVERAVARVARTPVARDAIVEVGGLAALDTGAAARLILPTACWLRAAGYRYAVFTATASLRNTFRRLRLVFWPIAPARIERLEPGEAGQWGNYYDHDPWVCGGFLGQIGSGCRAEGAGHAFKPEIGRSL